MKQLIDSFKKILHSKPPEEATDDGKAVIRGNVFTLRSAIFSPGGCIVIAVVVLIVYVIYSMGGALTEIFFTDDTEAELQLSRRQVRRPLNMNSRITRDIRPSTESAEEDQFENISADASDTDNILHPEINEQWDVTPIAPNVEANSQAALQGPPSDKNDAQSSDPTPSPADNDKLPDTENKSTENAIQETQDMPEEPKQETDTDSIIKDLQVAAVVANLEAALTHNNGDMIKSCLDELTRLKGENNIYVMNMKAFWHLSNNEFNTASIYLDKILKQNDADPQAGINMAVLEALTNRVDAAQRRLEQLAELNPDNSRINYLQEQISSLQ